MDKLKQQVGQEVDALADTLFSVSNFLLENPETAYEEFKACEHLSAVLEQNGFEVQKGVGNVETSFLARPAGCTPSRPAVALLAEYDALPKIGHGCGHNLIAAASMGAANRLNLARNYLKDSLLALDGKKDSFNVIAFSKSTRAFYSSNLLPATKENLRNALLGVHAGLIGYENLPSNYAGVAIYSEWEMDDEEWDYFEKEFEAAKRTTDP